MRRMCGFFGCLALLNAASAPIPTIFNTGVASNKPDGTPAALTAQMAHDQHYAIVSGIAGTISPFITSSSSVPYWFPDSSTSQWISPKASYPTSGFGIDPAGTYTYETTFDLTGFDLRTVVISGKVAADDYVAAIRINGFSIGFSGGSYNGFTSFSLPRGHYVSGVNAIAFDVINHPPAGVNPSGFRAELTGTASLVSAFQITSIVRTNFTDLLITWNTRGTNNIIQVAEGMGINGACSTNCFTDLTNLVVVTIKTNYLDVGAVSSGPSRFYRICSPD